MLNYKENIQNYIETTEYCSVIPITLAANTSLAQIVQIVQSSDKSIEDMLFIDMFNNSQTTLGVGIGIDISGTQFPDQFNSEIGQVTANLLFGTNAGCHPLTNKFITQKGDVITIYAENYDQSASRTLLLYINGKVLMQK